MHSLIRHDAVFKNVPFVIKRTLRSRGRKRESLSGADTANCVATKKQQNLGAASLMATPAPTQHSSAQYAYFSVWEEKIKQHCQTKLTSRIGKTMSSLSNSQSDDSFNECNGDVKREINVNQIKINDQKKNQDQVNNSDLETNENQVRSFDQEKNINNVRNIKEKIEIEAVTPENQYEKLAESVTPFWKMHYSQQLKEKEQRASNVLKLLKSKLIEVSAPSLQFPTSQLPCPLQPIIPSPEVLQYRNKDEFVVNKGVDGNPKTVGFLTGHPELTSTVCVSPKHLINIRDEHKLVCEHFERFIRGSKHPPCIHFRDSPGVWRTLVVRSNGQGDLMAIVVIHPHTLLEEEEIAIEEDLKEYFFSGAGSAVGLTSLYIQTCPHTRCTREHAPYRLLHGAPHIRDTMGGLDLTISPDTFLQINKSAAELLYSNAQQVAELSSATTLLDVCSGSGSISLLMSNSVRGTVGIESVTSAVADATRNAARNNITNATFIPGAVEQVLPLLTQELQGCSDVVAVVNPGRGGLNLGVINTLRANRAISKLLYLSCLPTGKAFQNFVALANCKTRNLRLIPPMLPRYAFTVDMFPQTEHYEMGILFLKEQ